MKIIWITWEKHRRTQELVSALSEVVFFEFDLEANRFVRYPILLFKTIRTLIHERPDLVIIQNPSIILAILMVTVRITTKTHVVLDSHNEGIRPFYSRYNWLLPIYAIIQRWADLTIVTNEELAKTVRKNGGKPFVLPDRLPQINNSKVIKLKGKSNVVFVCTFAKDEPFSEVIKAAQIIAPSTCIYITGKYQNASTNIIGKAPPNVIFTGFMSDQSYINLLNSCDVVIDLTLMQDCLVCGAYEAIVLGKPLILSDTRALRNYFYSGAVYTKNYPKNIASAIKIAIENNDKLISEIIVLRNQLTDKWDKQFRDFVCVLEYINDL